MASIPHTPEPWKVYKREGQPYKMSQCGGTVFTPGDILIAETYTAEDAEYIALAVNERPAHIRLIRDLLDLSNHAPICRLWDTAPGVCTCGYRDAYNRALRVHLDMPIDGPQAAQQVVAGTSPPPETINADTLAALKNLLFRAFVDFPYDERWHTCIQEASDAIERAEPGWLARQLGAEGMPTSINSSVH